LRSKWKLLSKRWRVAADGSSSEPDRRHGIHSHHGGLRALLCRLALDRFPRDRASRPWNRSWRQRSPRHLPL